MSSEIFYDKAFIQVEEKYICRFTIDMLQLNKKRSREHSLVL